MSDMQTKTHRIVRPHELGSSKTIGASCQRATNRNATCLVSQALVAKPGYHGVIPLVGTHMSLNLFQSLG